MISIYRNHLTLIHVSQHPEEPSVIDTHWVGKQVVLINITVSWEDSGITWETGLWTCLWGITLIMLTELGGHAPCGCRHSPTKTLDCVSGEKTLNSSLRSLLSSLSASLLWIHCDRLLQVPAALTPLS